VLAMYFALHRRRQMVHLGPEPQQQQEASETLPEDREWESQPMAPRADGES